MTNPSQFIMSIAFIAISILLASLPPCSAAGKGGCKAASSNSTLYTYIIRVHPPQRPPSTPDARLQHYASFFPSGVNASDRLIYSYSNVICGFAARLTADELSNVARKSGFICAHPDLPWKLATTHSPRFLGLARGVPGFWEDSNYGNGVIIGVMDTGVDLHHPSFSAVGMPPPPSKWNGTCEFNGTDQCNNKIIGARVFLNGGSPGPAPVGPPTPYDNNGHGSHVAATAAGAFFRGANFNGLAYGTASGIAPQAHLAIYKVCDDFGFCNPSDQIAGLDQAISDGVDIVSVSIGGGTNLSFYDDPVGTAAFAAAERGIFLSYAATNDGPDAETVMNGYPWVLTVGASTMDRTLRSTVSLKKTGHEYNGETAYQPRNFSSTPLPLVYPGITGDSNAASCFSGSLNVSDIEGKIVICDAYDPSYQSQVLQEAGIAAVIVANTATQGYVISEPLFTIPAAQVSFRDGLLIKAAAASPDAAAAIVFKGTIIGNTTVAPVVAYFSSRGPNYADPYILKPDIVGPGVNIVAAWPFQPPGSTSASGPFFNLQSGTSMATPHLSGVAALLKSKHPDWSPAAIKSAIMTTARVTANDGKPIKDQAYKPATYYDFGAGLVNPASASNPGLIYNLSSGEYLRHLCGLNYTDDQVTAVAGRQVNCSRIGSTPVQDLNLPSIVVTLDAANNYTKVAKRKVTSVGFDLGHLTYAAEVLTADPLKIEVQPKVLCFSPSKRTAEYSVKFTAKKVRGSSGKTYEGYLSWISSEKTISVGSPLVVMIQ